MTMKRYNGHPNYNHWNVAMWISNDEGLYRSALDCVKHAKTKPEAAERFLQMLQECGINKTPDGAPYTKTTVLHAMRGLE